MRSLRAVLFLGFVVGSLIGCSGPASEPAHSAIEQSISGQQRDALKDGRITWDEYQSAFKAYAACLTKKGYELVNPQVKDDLMDFGVPGAAVESGADETCYAYNWGQVDGVWQIDHEDTSESAQIVAHCLQVNGYTPAEKYQDNLELLKTHGIDIADCPVNG
ncbi:hypothetical protein [Leifsonia sp. 2MCAF36]|uniref:hypothetical protein n=1 Tax=Leifsonia sp. 2MCAF36 TaxID=3232988 RepID=UPI003F9839EC